MIDLHTHSSASDGSLSPSGLIEEAARRGISALALTDHDTIGGLKEAAEAAQRLGIGFIPGIELQILWNGDTGGEFHLLGLGINKPSPGFYAAVEELNRRREKRNLDIIDSMNKAGITVTYEEIRALANGTNVNDMNAACTVHGTACTAHGTMTGVHSIGRPHFAAYMVQRKIVKNREQAFVRFLGKGKPFYIPKAGLEFEMAAAAIKESGGIAVLAHPMSLFLSWGRLPDMITGLKEKGLDGLEAWHPTAKVSSCRRLEDLGNKLKLIVTAGSDFHGEGRPDRKLGITAGGKKIGEEYLEKIPCLSG